MIRARIQDIVPGRWFQDGGGRKMMKISDVTGGGVPSGLARMDFRKREPSMALEDACGGFGDFNVNAVDDRGIPCCCPPDMDIFFVSNEEDLRSADFRGEYPVVGSDFRHVGAENER